MLKRTFDIAFALTLLLLTSPLSILIMLGIKLEDSGPLLFRNERIGKGGKIFEVLKFRSMVPDAESRFGRDEVRPGDRRITRMGRVLRASALDELPQLVNILRGDMSVVGPRPLVPVKLPNEMGNIWEIEAVPNFGVRTRVRPGLTGLAQVYLPRTASMHEKFHYDALYVRCQSFWLDLRLVLLSFWISVTGGWERPRKHRKAKSRAKAEQQLLRDPHIPR